MSPDLFPELRADIEGWKTAYPQDLKERQENGEYLMRSPVLPLLAQGGLVLREFYGENVYLSITEPAMHIDPAEWALTPEPVNLRLSWGFAETTESARSMLRWVEVIVIVRRGPDRKILGLGLSHDQTTIDDNDIPELARHLDTALTNPVEQIQPASRRHGPRHSSNRRFLSLGERRFGEIRRIENNQLVGVWHDETDQEYTLVINSESYSPRTTRRTR